MIGRSLRAAVDLRLLGERAVILDCDVLQADGGTRTAAITGAYVALALALRSPIEAGQISAQVLRSAVAAVSVGIVDGTPMLDLCYDEDQRADVDLNVAMTDRGEFVELQGTAEGAAFGRAALDGLLDLAAAGIDQLLREQQSTLVGRN
jgi:ribonuclease PH